MTGILAATAEAYHADALLTPEPTLSASIAKILIAQSPLHAWTQHPRLNPNYERKTEDKFDLGTAAHALLLEGREAVELIYHDNYKTKDAQTQRDAARAAGKVPMLDGQWADVQAMCAAVRDQLAALDVEPTPFTDGRPEQTIVWEENGVTCRALIDWLHDDFLTLDDMKTAGRTANPDVWRRTMYGFGGDVQVAFHSRGVKAVTGVEPLFRFVVCETSPPYAVSVVTLDAEARAIAEAKVDRALEIWRDCLDSGLWPGYAQGVTELRALPWETRWLDDPELEAVAWEQM